MTKDQAFDVITETSLRSLLGEDGGDFSIRVFDELDSTNTEAKRLAMSGEQRALIFAKHQTAGRGRMGRSFYSPPESGVYFSLLMPFPKGVESGVFLTCAVSVAVMRAIRTLTGKQTEIKWVNDLFWQKKKVCGILCESMNMGGESAVIIGIGINLKTAEFPRELTEIAGSLCEDRLTRAELICEICRELFYFLKTPDHSLWLNDYRQNSMVLGKPVQWIRDGEVFEGIAEDILEDGALLVKDQTGQTIALRTGEISLRLSPR